MDLQTICIEYMVVVELLFNNFNGAKHFVFKHIIFENNLLWYFCPPPNYTYNQISNETLTQIDN